MVHAHALCRTQCLDHRAGELLGEAIHRGSDRGSEMELVDDAVQYPTAADASAY